MASAAADTTKVNLIYNPEYKRSGLKSYVALLNKYNIRPTKPGPYFAQNVVQTQGKFGANMMVGGKTRVKHRLMKRPGYGRGGRHKPHRPHGPHHGPDPEPSGIPVPAEDQQYDTEYLSPVTIGTPGKTFNLDFDTGSADLWLWSTELDKSISTAGHHVFDPAASSTFKKTDGSTWLIQYGDGSTASGSVGTDIVKIGSLTVENQTIELAQQLSPFLVQNVADGLLGLSFGNRNTVSPPPVKTPVENMIDQRDIPKDMELFTAYLGSWRDVNDTDKGASFYTFGYLDKGALAGQTPYYTPVDNSQGLWQFASTTAMVGDRPIDRTDNTAVADTGSTLALIDDALCDAIYAAIPGGRYAEEIQGYIFPSNTTVDQLPDVSFAVGDQLFAVQKEDLGFADAGLGMTYGGIQSRGSLSFDILGDTWLKGVYAVSDLCFFHFFLLRLQWISMIHAKGNAQEEGGY